MTSYGGASPLIHPQVINCCLSGKTPALTGNAHPNYSPYDRYRTKTVDIFVGAGNDRAFRRLCEGLKKPELAEDPRFRSNRDRVTNRADLTAELESLMVKIDGEALCDKLLRAGVPAGPVLDVAQVMNIPHTRPPEMAVEPDRY